MLHLLRRPGKSSFARNRSREILREHTAWAQLLRVCRIWCGSTIGAFQRLLWPNASSLRDDWAKSIIIEPHTCKVGARNRVSADGDLAARMRFYGQYGQHQWFWEFQSPSPFTNRSVEYSTHESSVLPGKPLGGYLPIQFSIGQAFFVFCGPFRNCLFADSLVFCRVVAYGARRGTTTHGSVVKVPVTRKNN
jgi:hypothetical protein